MNIFYSRLSGPINVSPVCKTAIGGWYEKRIAFLKTLIARGHKVRLLGKVEYGNMFMGGLGAELFDNSIQQPDLIFIEFGSNNKNFYGKQITFAEELADKFKGRCIYICDDPELFWPGDSGLINWFNARQNLPDNTFDFPFHTLVDALPCRPPVHLDLIYFGRFSGRKKLLQDILTRVPLKLYSTDAEGGFQVQAPPNQVDRYDFYARQMCSLSLNDNKHKHYLWRTGRAYHSLTAGCPVIVEREAEPYLSGFKTPAEIPELFYRVVQSRESILKEQREIIYNDINIANQTFKTFDL